MDTQGLLLQSWKKKIKGKIKLYSEKVFVLSETQLRTSFSNAYDWLVQLASMIASPKWQ